MRRKRTKGHGRLARARADFRLAWGSSVFIDHVRILETMWPSVELIAASAFAKEFLISAIRPARARASTREGGRAPRDHTPND